LNLGLWKRAQFDPAPGEGDAECIGREARNVRTNAGLVDVSTLGKIELRGPDTAEFLGRVYANRWDTLRVGRCRYGLMLREDGFVLDDGTTARLGPEHHLMTTTTANAARVMQHLEFLLQTAWLADGSGSPAWTAATSGSPTPASWRTRSMRPPAAPCACGRHNAQAPGREVGLAEALAHGNCRPGAVSLPALQHAIGRQGGDLHLQRATIGEAVADDPRPPPRGRANEAGHACAAC